MFLEYNLRICASAVGALYEYIIPPTVTEAGGRVDEDDEWNRCTGQVRSGKVLKR